MIAGRDKDVLDAIGVARRHRAKLDVPYLRSTVQRICDAAEDTAAWNRFERVLEAGKRDA